MAISGPCTRQKWSSTQILWPHMSRPVGVYRETYREQEALHVKAFATE